MTSKNRRGTPKPATVIKTHRIGCPDCGIVDCIVEGWAHGVPVCGVCPECGDYLYFAPATLPETTL